MNYLKISIITPSFNQGQYIEQTIDSVLSQNYPSLEYIIIDGGSTDNTVEIIKKYQKHLKYWICEPDQGQSDAINKGFQHVTGDIFNWINSDDYYEEDTFSVLVEHFQNPSVNCVCGKSKIVDPNNTRISKGTYLAMNNLSKTIGNAQIDQPATFFRTQCMLDLLPLSKELNYLMDREFWIKYLLQYKFNGIESTDQPIVNFRMHEHSKTVSEFDYFNIERESIFHALMQQIGLVQQARFLRENYQLIEEYTFPAKISSLNKPIISSAIHYYLLLLLDEAYYLRKYKLAKKISEQIDFQQLSNKDWKFARLLQCKNQIKNLINLW